MPKLNTPQRLINIAMPTGKLQTVQAGNRSCVMHLTIYVMDFGGNDLTSTFIVCEHMKLRATGKLFSSAILNSIYCQMKRVFLLEGDSTKL